MIKICLSVVAGVGAVIALTVAYRKQQHAEAAEARADAADRREQTKVFTERFGSCAEQLGSDKPAIRLAGMYALAQLADDWDGGRQTCLDVLCAYLRMPYDSEPATDDPAHGAWSREQQVRHTGWRLIGDHLRPNATTVSWSGRNFDFTGAVIDGADLHGAVVSGDLLRFTDAAFAGGKVDLDGAEFSGGKVYFTSATFSDAEVSFSRATFSAGVVDFYRAEFSGGNVDFSHATISGGDMDFTGATFSDGLLRFAGTTFSGGKVRFTRATISGGDVNFFGAIFSGGEVDFRDVKFSAGKVAFFGVMFSAGKVNFFGVMFSGGVVDFTGATFSGGVVHFTGATFSGGVVHFTGATFSGGVVHFTRATFSGGTVDLSSPRDYDSPPQFDSWSMPPAGLLLPEQSISP
jgi:uncharacterized protein YjbI with pentapeptide repeats